MVAVPESIPQSEAALADLYFLQRLPLWARIIAAATALALLVAGGVWLEGVHRYFAGQISAGEEVNSLGRLLGSGSSPVTAWPGWAATLFFAFALYRLRRDQPEPPAGMRASEQRSVAQLRAGLRREYTATRTALVVVTAIALVDVARNVAGLTAAHTATAVAWSAAEALGLVAAAALLALWALTFRTELERWGAI